MDALTRPPAPVNEPNLTYAPGSPERADLEQELKRQEDRQLDLCRHRASKATASVCIGGR